MRRSTIAIATVLGLAAAQPAVAQDASEVVAQFNAAYNDRDLDAFIATFAEDAVVVWEGIELVGREAIADGYAADFTESAPQSRITRQGRAGGGAIVLEEALVFGDGSEECCTASIITVRDGRISRIVIRENRLGG